MQTCTLSAFGVLMMCSVAVTAAPQLFQPLPGAANARMSVTAPTGPADPSCWSVMRLNAAALQSGEWELNLPCAGNLTAQGGLQAGANQRAAVQDYGADEGTTSWVGTVAQNPLSIVAVTTGPTGVVSGSIMLKGETHNIEYRVGDTYSIYKVDDSKLPVDHPKPVIPPGVKAVYTAPQHFDTAARTATKAPTPKPTAAKSAASTHVDTATRAATASGRKLLAETPGQVDVGIFWTGNAQKAVGGAAQMQARIRAAVVATNAVYAASKLTVRLRLVYMGYLAGYTADGIGHDMGATLASFAINGDKVMDDAFNVRARYGLDAMVLISNDASYCGLAYVMNNPATFTWPFSVVAPSCLPLTLAHELGHNFGMQHDHAQAVAGTPYKDSSFGYRVAGDFSTIMAYPCTAYANCVGCAPCPRIPYFSNPVIKSDKVAVGKKNWADATGTLNDPPVLSMMANWGKRRNPGTPSTPTGVTAVQTTSNYFKVNWAGDPKNAADGFYVYRKTTILNLLGLAQVSTWSLARDTGSGASKYWVDTRKYAKKSQACYKVVAYNFNAKSNYSKQVCVTKK